MGDSGKPFACTEMGCNQRFVNEDHLEVHRRKHEMSLGLRDLKSLDTPVIADQTPTPTRFLKNCVEEGLFNEHPNPFDALFRRASTFRPADGPETSSKGTAEDTPLDISDRVVEIDSSDNEQALEDPSSQQAVALTMGEETQQRQRQQSEESLGIEDLPGASQVVEVSTISPTAAQEVLPVFQQAQATVVQTMAPMVQNRVPIHQTIQLDRNTIPISGPILLRLPTGQTIPVVPPSVANPQAPIPVAISAVPQVSVVVTGTVQTVPLDSKSVKQKLKNNLLANQSQGNMGVMTQAVDVVTRQQGLSNPNFAEVAQDLSSPESQIKRRRRNSDMSEDEKREKFLERNRAAATRCRNKRKMWVNNLEQKADEYKSTNNVLMNEVTKLRDEVASLKQLLLAHNDCPVTIQQRQSGGNLFAALDMQKKDPSVGGDSLQSPQPEEANALPR